MLDDETKTGAQYKSVEIALSQFCRYNKGKLRKKQPPSYNSTLWYLIVQGIKYMIIMTTLSSWWPIFHSKPLHLSAYNLVFYI